MVYVLLEDCKPIAVSGSLSALCATVGVNADAVRMQFKRRGFYKSAICSIFAVKLVQDGRKGNKNGKISNFGDKRKVFVADVGGLVQQSEQNKPKKSDLHYIPDEF